ncbi:hypothetical protein M407DRAFT_99376 [Tulasnella calospora MUT 4182]|uniref:Uncharacterized protein n=1 Tax=Tulasnella calospora MUT 4182 TaxID=1051891 RepID=A0A0C3KSY7_9AGAM|nr:hypothetical protein M407DRAFT_99376 [Tulasnella calospora MUT 4182]
MSKLDLPRGTLAHLETRCRPEGDKPWPQSVSLPKWLCLRVVWLYYWSNKIQWRMY